MLTSAALLAVAFVVAAASAVFLRKRSARRLGAGSVLSRTERLIGQIGEVTLAIDPVKGSGRVLVSGEDWAATSMEPLHIGAKVIVDGADGIVLNVTPEN